MYTYLHVTPLAWRRICVGYFPHSESYYKSPPKMLSSKENIADVQVQQIQSKAPPHDSGKEEGKLAQSEYHSVRATMSATVEAIEAASITVSSHSLAQCASPPLLLHLRKHRRSGVGTSYGLAALCGLYIEWLAIFIFNNYRPTSLSLRMYLLKVENKSSWALFSTHS